jgi:hypothetical protein
VWPVLKLAARAAVWRVSRTLPLVGLPILLAWAVVLGLVRMALQYAAAGATPHFNPYGINAVAAWLAIELAVAALFVRPVGRATALSAMFVLSIISEIVIAAIRFTVPLLAPTVAASGFWSGTAATAAAFVIEVVWWLGAMVCVLRSLEVHPRVHLVAKTAALLAALFVADAVVPHAPVFLPRDFDISTANWWEFLRARYLAKSGGGELPQAENVAQLDQAQPALLQAEVAALAPRRDHATNLYVIGVAGWAGQDVFIKELDGALASLTGVLPIKNRIIRLVNDRDTVARTPLADLQNFAAAVHAVGTVMDKADDVLVLLMTSHGDQSGFALQVPGHGVFELTPKQVAATLDDAGIKNRAVIVSACYAGIFLPPLANDNTIVMTAADDKSTSFGCAPERDWTYFGDALFRQSLQPGTDFQQAFDHARVLIQGWELMDRAHPSNPQGYFGPALVAKLQPLFASAQGSE